jgi:hypothetical protein
MPDTLSDQLARAIQKSKEQGVSDAAISAGLNNFLALYAQQMNEKRDRALRERALELQYGDTGSSDWGIIEQQASGQEGFPDVEFGTNEVQVELPSGDYGFSTAYPEEMAKQQSPSLSDYMVSGEASKEDLFRQTPAMKESENKQSKAPILTPNSNISIENIDNQTPKDSTSFLEKYISMPIMNMRKRLRREPRFKTREEALEYMRK